MSAPIFSRRHYVAIAALVRDAGYLDDHARSQLLDRLSELFSGDNERFRPERFKAAADPQLSERDRLEARGYRDGYAAATWLAPEDEQTARWILDGLDSGDPVVLDYLPSPRLGGEWADEPTWANILADEGCDDSDDGRPELLDAYCHAYACAVEREIVRSCRALLGLYPVDLAR